MTVRLDQDGAIRLEGACPVEDAEPLLRLLLDNPGAIVDCTACERAHTALVQLLHAARRTQRGKPIAPFRNIY